MNNEPKDEFSRSQRPKTPLLDQRPGQIYGENGMIGQLKNPAKEVILADGSRIMLGLPALDENGNFIMPNTPHVFASDVTLVKQGDGSAIDDAINRRILRSHTVGTTQGESLGRCLDLGNCVVILAHGINRGAGAEWYFADNQHVPTIVQSYSDYAKTHGLPEIDLIAACNADPNEVDLVTNQPLSEDNAVRVGAFNVQEGEDDDFTYVVGEKAKSSGRIDPKLGIVVSLRTRRTRLFGIEKLIARKEQSRLQK